MVSTFTPNIQLEEPARGDQVGTWDTPVNTNMTLIDLLAGGISTIVGSAGSVVLAAAQFQSKQIAINSTLLASITLTFPTSYKKSYEVQNTCTGSSVFVITLQTTAAGGQAVCCPPGEIIDVVNDGANIKFKNLGRVGTTIDWNGSSVPAWISGCTVPPYLDCNGTAFSSATYPQLAMFLGGTTLPDARGRTAYYLNEGTARLTAALSGIDGNTRGGNGGSDGVALAVGHIPSIASGGLNTITVTVPGTGASRVPYSTNGDLTAYSAAGGGPFVAQYSPGNNWAYFTSLSVTPNIVVAYNNGAQVRVPATTPGYVVGLCLIRAA